MPEPLAPLLPPVECRLVNLLGSQLDTRPDVAVARLAADEWSILSIEELRACGLTHRAVWHRVRNGRLHPMHRGVFAVGHANPPLQGRFLAAVKACGLLAVLSHRSAGVLWRMIDWEERLIEVTVPGPGTRLVPGLRVHRSRSLEWPDVVRHEGIPVTSPARTLADLAATMPDRALRRAVRNAVGERLVTLGQLAEVVDRLGRRPGAARLRRILAAGPAPTRSELEDVVLDLLDRGGLRRPEVNAPLLLAGRRVIPDFRWPEARLVLEADGAAWHEHRIAREDDAERQALLEAHGERVVRVTWRQAVGSPEQTLARLRAAGAPAA
jgi:hypothetical protein